MTEKEYALCFKALSDETRLKIVGLLKGDSLCACKILDEFNITQPTLSYHMKALVECGLVSVKKDGIWNHYSVNNELLGELAKLISSCPCKSNTDSCS